MSETGQGNDREKRQLSRLEIFQIVVGTAISILTAFIGWQTLRLNSYTSENNVRLSEIEQRLEQTKFGFEQVRDVYDRTEKYLMADEQDESHGKLLVAFISSLPETDVRKGLLTVVSEIAKSSLVAAKAADVQAGVPQFLADKIDDASFTGNLSLLVDTVTYQVTTVGEFEFTDSLGTTWTVPQGTVANGAQIPRSVWPAVGSPLTGDYAIPTVLYEYYATRQTRSADAVNQMFYESLIKVGVQESKAKVLYFAVKHFGPRWDVEQK